MDNQPVSKPIYKSLYFQVITAIVIGVLLGHFYPHTGEAMKPLGDGFIKLIKMIIAPLVFCVVVHGICSTGDLKKVGRVGGEGRGAPRASAIRRRAPGEGGGCGCDLKCVLTC